MQPEQDILSTQEDHRTLFFEHYRKETEEYDKEFIKKYDEDLNTTLIFVSPYSVQGMCANLLTGWSILRCHLRFHPRRPVSTPARHG